MGRSINPADSDYYSSGDSGEVPEHDVLVSDFYLDTFEVTVGRFRKFVEQYDGSLEANPAWQAMLENAKRLHLVGMVSNGGVHSHIEHLMGMLHLLRKTDLEPVVHMITDGRDTAPKAALAYLGLNCLFAGIYVGLDVQVPGMLYASLARPPAYRQSRHPEHGVKPRD